MEERDEYAAACAGMDRALADLRTALAPAAARHGAKVEDVANMVMLKRRDPAEFNRLHAAAAQGEQTAKAIRSRLQQAAQELHEALQQADTSSPAEKLQAFHLLGQLRAQIAKLK
jgi:predicted RNase H-like HicB family nuclease